MGVMDRFLGAGAAVATVTNAATGMAGLFRENATRRMELDEEAYARAIAQYGAEFSIQPCNWFDSLMNGLNRLPRPLMTLGTVGLFVYAMADPEGFGLRMQGLNLVPEPLWWLLGAVISFYFGAREAHYFRTRPIIPASAGPGQMGVKPLATAQADRAESVADNPALSDWLAAGGTR
ncbi:MULTISPECIES: holin family protein [Paracoccus]|uniref:holin family protein n=2 Tax=Paracoccaceae TaxID=31989 RepID=UPI000A0D4570|nr:Holin of 3TMs, for gene-transfer release [Paracoccus sp. J56]